jgi:class 3 adenylate cyclase
MCGGSEELAAVACGACGTEPVRDGALFCDACGAPIAATRGPARNQPAHEQAHHEQAHHEQAHHEQALLEQAEYKQVTVLFADVVGSMDIASNLDPERFREIMTEVFDRCAAAVQRYGGTVDKFTGDGVMALFGAPVALEDHALRGCLAALGIQQETRDLAAQVARRDRVALRLRVWLNSGQVVAGDSGSGPIGYTVFGAHVGMAQRIESVAPPGGVMLSESTARLVENVAVLGEPQRAHIKGTDIPVSARQLIKIVADPVLTGRRSWTLVGRQWEINALAGMLDESIAGRGRVVGVIGAPGIGKTRLACEIAGIASDRGVEVLSTFCESHATQIPIHVLGRLMRAVFRVKDLLDPAAARAVIAARLPEAQRDDLLILNELAGVGDSAAAIPDIDPDARQRRLVQLIKTALLARRAPACYVIEDVHWIDETSEAMFAEFFSVIPRTHSMVLVTCRPEYRGALTDTASSETITLAPLSDSQSEAFATEMLGAHASVQPFVAQVVERAAGNPLFAQEIVRDLVERGVLTGDFGGLVCTGDVVDVSVPATIAATIAARIDRLGAAAKRTLNAAAVIGSRFDETTLTGLIHDVALTELADAELIYPLVFSPHTEYVFGHPMIQKVAYESQLKSGRATLHRRLAQVIERRDADSVEENAAMIATHLEAAGDLTEAFSWHMRAGTGHCTETSVPRG